MNVKSFANYLCATALALLSAVANAGPVYKFELTGAYAATWLLTVPVVPDDTFSGQQFTLWNVVGSFEKASTSKADITFFNTAEGGGLNLYDFAAHANLLSTDGPQLYTGTEGSPIFNLGAYALTQFQRAGQYTLVISEVSPVPEPASLAMTVCGLVGIAAATRRRRRTMCV